VGSTVGGIGEPALITPQLPALRGIVIIPGMLGAQWPSLHLFYI